MNSGRVENLRAKHNTCLNNPNLGSVIGVKGKKPNLGYVTMLLQLTEKILPPHRIWIPENLCYYPPLNMDPGKLLLLPPPPLNPFGQNSVCPPKWMLARTPMYTWRDSKLSDNTDIRQFNTLVIPTGTYGCEKCKITVRINNFKIDVFHHKCK